MISDNPTVKLSNGQEVPTDPTPHMRLMFKDEESGELTLVHYTKGKVEKRSFKNEADFKERMPYEVYIYDTAEYKPID